MLMLQKLFRSSLMLAVVLAAPPAAAITLDFEEFTVHGRVVASSKGVGISATNLGGGPDLAVAFDSNLLDTNDEDLQRLSPNISGGETGWRKGNLAPDTDLGFLLILQENDDGCSMPNDVCEEPDDEGTEPPGSISFDFTQVEVGLFTSLEFDIVDLDNSVSEDGSVEFFHKMMLVGSITFAELEPMNGVTFGNNSANRMPTIEVSSLGDSAVFDKVTFHLGGSGALDNISAAPIPEPSAALVFAVGLGITGASLRRRR